MLCRPRKCFPILAVVMVFGACTASSPLSPFSSQRSVWPEPPNDERIAFVGEFSRAKDLGIQRSAWARFVSFAAGSGDNAMIRPMAVAATADGGIIFVADTEAQCVHRYDLIKGRYDRLTPAKNEAPVFPVGLAVTEDGWLFVSDSQQKRLFIVAPGKKQLEPFPVGASMIQPTGIFWDAESQHLLVTDTGGQLIQVFDRNGNLKSSFGGRGSAPGEFNFPTYLWKAAESDLLVADSLNFRIQRFDSQGNVLFAFGENGDEPGDFSRPKGVATDTFGHIYVVDALMHTMQIFSPEGELLLAIGGQGQAAGQFWLPNGIYITSDNLILVADTYNKRVQVFRYVGAGK